MRLLQHAGGGWALLEDGQTELRLIAGGLNAWAPRLASGEGRHALPLTGQRLPLERLVSGAGAYRAVVSLETSPGRGEYLAGVVGKTLLGQRDPFRSFVGYTLAVVPARGAPAQVAPIMVTADEPGLSKGLPHRGPLAERLWRLDGDTPLRTGDVVILCRSTLADEVGARLRGDDLALVGAKRNTRPAGLNERGPPTCLIQIQASPSSW